MAKANAKLVHLSGEVPTDGGNEAIQRSEPYRAAITICGSADLLFHRWNVEGVESKANAAKGSKAKKTDDLETYVYRDSHGMLSLPGEYLRQSVIMAAKFRQDPRSPRKSAMDLYKAGVVSLTLLASLGVDTWDYEDKRRVTIQRNAITRVRPALHAGWKATIEFAVLLPEYIMQADLHDVVTNAGRLVGVGDFRPTYGRFQIIGFDIL
jgi:hypothetical protein